MSIERGKTSEQAQTPGAKKYTAALKVIEPKKHAGSALFDTFTIGNEDDPKAQLQETWASSAGAKKLKRLLKRAGVPAVDGDDEEWMDAAQGQEVCAHVTKERDENGQVRNRINGNYFKENDDDFVGVGESLEAEGGRSSRGNAKANGKAQHSAARPARRQPVEDDEEEGPPQRRAKPDDEEEEAPKARPAKQAKADDDDEEEEKAPPKRTAAKGARAAKKSDDDDDDED